MNGRGDARYIADAHCGRQRSSKRLKVIDIARVLDIIIFAANDVDSVFNLEQLDESKPECDKNAAAKQDDNH